MFSLKSRIFQILMPSQQEGWRDTRSWEGTEPGQLTQSGQWGIPYHVMSCLVYKMGGEGLQGIAAQGLTGCRLAGGEQLHCASLVYSNPFIIIIVIYRGLTPASNYAPRSRSLTCPLPPVGWGRKSGKVVKLMG